jgi:hypothetical protein
MEVAEEAEVEGSGGDTSPRNSTHHELRVGAGDAHALGADDDEAVAVIENVSRRVEQTVYRSDSEWFIVWKSLRTWSSTTSRARRSGLCRPSTTTGR